MWKPLYYNIFNPKVKKGVKTRLLKTSLDFSELCELVDQKINRSDKKLSEYIYGNPLPANYDSLGSPIPNPSTSNFENEVNWILIAIRQHADRIQRFVDLRSEYEKSFLLGDYVRSENILTAIEEDVCCSIWTLESRLYLLEIFKSQQDQKSFLSEFNRVNKGIFTPFIAHYFSIKSEESFSFLKYRSDLRDILTSQKFGLDSEEIEGYYNKLNFYGLNSYSKFPHLLFFENYNSVIDRYLTLIRVFTLVLTTDGVPTNLVSFVHSKIKYLRKKISDKNLDKLAILCNGQEIMSVQLENISHEIADAFVGGDYHKTIDILRTELVNDPSAFENYIIYAMSYLYLNRGIVSPVAGSNLQSRIISAIYNVLSRVEAPDDSLSFLNRLTLQLANFSIAPGIHNFISAELSANAMPWKAFDSFSYSPIHATFGESIIDKKTKEEYYDGLLSVLPGSISANLYVNKNLRGRFDFIPIGLPEKSAMLEEALALSQEKHFNRSLPIWTDLYFKYNEIVPVFETVSNGLFGDLCASDSLDSAIDIYIRTYFQNKIIAKKINCSPLHDSIRKSKFRNVSPTINLPIFYTLSGSDENERHTAYERFNVSIGIERASQLPLNIISEDLQKAIFYLSNTCTIELFKHSIFIDGTKERYTERIQILQLLSQIDPLNSSAYAEELNGLTEKLIILDGLQQLDESKIYVNEQGLLISELSDYEGIFNRFRTVTKMVKDTDVLFLDVRSGKLKSISSIEGKDGLAENKVFSSHPLTDVFEELFNIVKDKFLNSNFGITAYLSTRIRHGELLGVLRPIFERNFLISNKDNLTGAYQRIDYWDDRYDYLSGDAREELQGVLAKFSEVIDQEIQKLIRVNLQISVDPADENLAWFDYYFSPTALTIFATGMRDVPNYSEFLNKVITILWGRTDDNLALIRGKINTNVKSDFNTLLNKLDSDLSAVFARQRIPEVYTNITTCRTEVQNALDRIASWFNRSGTTTNDFTVDRVVTVVLENLQHGFPSKRIDLKKSIKNDCMIKGEYYPHFADLFRIFFENILKHSTNVPAVMTELLVDYHDSVISILISNFDPDPDKLDKSSYHGSPINQIKISSEGKSGFHKARKIIISDLKNKDNMFSAEIENGLYTVKVQINTNDLIR